MIGSVKALLLLLLATLTTQAATFTGKVVGVSDGDTITVLAAGNVQYKIRLEGIDTPESSQPFGVKAKQALSQRVFGKVVTVQWEKTDRYKRTLGHILLGQRWINHEMVAEGWAWHYKQYSKDQRLAAAEVKAKAARKGLWAGPNPVAPWDWRRGKGLPRVQQTAGGDYKVFLTRTGGSYHRDGCRFLSKSKVSSTLGAIANRYLPCKVCNPPMAKNIQQAKPISPPVGNHARKGVVFVTKSGKKYHSAGCRYLSKSKIAIVLANARRSHSPCSKCAPPR